MLWRVGLKVTYESACMVKTFNRDSDKLNGVDDPDPHRQDMIQFIFLDSDNRHDK